MRRLVIAICAVLVFAAGIGLAIEDNPWCGALWLPAGVLLALAREKPTPKVLPLSGGGE